jgi:hypothetical protein
MSSKEYTGADDVLAKIAKYPDDFRPTAEKLHETIMGAAGTLYPRLWYGMPGYAKTKTGPVLVYFRKDKYITFGQTESAHLEFDSESHGVGVAWLFTEINGAAMAKITRVVQSAVK